MEVKSSEDFGYKAEIRIPFETPKHAEIAMQTMEVDKELKPDRVSRVLTVEGSSLVARIAAIDPKHLRQSLSGVFDMAGVVARTLQEFA